MANLTNEMIDYPLYFIYSMEYFRHELVKARYLFMALRSSNSTEEDRHAPEDVQQIEKFLFSLNELLRDFVCLKEIYPNWMSIFIQLVNVTIVKFPIGKVCYFSLLKWN